MSEALIFASTNPQYDDRLFIELLVQYIKIPSSNLGRTCCVQKLFLTFRTIFVHNMFSPCSAKIRTSDKDLPVKKKCIKIFKKHYLLDYLLFTRWSISPSQHLLNVGFGIQSLILQSFNHKSCNDGSLSYTLAKTEIMYPINVRALVAMNFT